MTDEINGEIRWNDHFIENELQNLDTIAVNVHYIQYDTMYILVTLKEKWNETTNTYGRLNNIDFVL
ncbi:hypothetical protein ES708_25977 [subsurface metagenome]